MEKLEKIAVKDIRTNPFQPRKVFDQEKLEELAEKNQALKLQEIKKERGKHA